MTDEQPTPPLTEIVVEWIEGCEPFTALATVEVLVSGRSVVKIDRVTREQVDAVAANFTAAEREMRWHEARWFEASGFQRTFGSRAKEHLVAASADPEHARPLCGIQPVGLTDRVSWYRVWPLVGEPRKGRDRCSLCWRRYERSMETPDE